MRIVRNLCFLLPLAVSIGVVNAQDAAPKLNSFYFGGGVSNSTDEFDDDSMPYSIGFLHQSEGKKLLFGFDLAGEGTSIDSTYLMNQQPVQAMSFNLLVGQNLSDDGHFKVDAALLAGIRNTAADCPDSYLGFACYADEAPTIEYTVNYGAVLTVSYNNVLLGLRVTGESTQLLAGFRF